MSNDKINLPTAPAVDIHSIALGAARKIAAIDPSKMPGGAVQALAAIQVAVREAIELYGSPHEQELIRRSLPGVVDPNEWAVAFCTFVPNAVLGKLERSSLANWFGDAIMRGFDIASQRSVKRLTMIYECERILGDPKATDQMKRSASHTKDALLDRQDHGLALVDRRELEEAKAKLDRAVRALQRSGFQDLGGEEWQPPVNEVAGKLQQRVYELEQDLAMAREAHEKTAGELVDVREQLQDMESCKEQAMRGASIQNLALLTARLSYQLNKAQPGNEFSQRATNYLKRHNLIGSPLRNEEGRQELAEIELTPEQRATLSTASANLEGVDIGAAHKGICRPMDPEEVKAFIRAGDHVMTETGPIGISPDTCIRRTESIHHASVDVLAEMGALPGSSDASALKTAGLPVGEYVDIDTALKMVHMPYSEEEDEQAQESGKEQTKAESDTSEQVMQEKQQRKGVFIPGARWPVPGERRFTLDRRDPMNPANRSDPIERSAKDRRKGGKHDS